VTGLYLQACSRFLNGLKLVRRSAVRNAGRYLNKQRAPIGMGNPCSSRSAAGILQSLCLNAAMKKLSYGGLAPQPSKLASDMTAVVAEKRGPCRHHAKNGDVDVDDSD
jgi:hypothetical protein